MGYIVPSILDVTSVSAAAISICSIISCTLEGICRKDSDTIRDITTAISNLSISQSNLESFITSVYLIMVLYPFNNQVSSISLGQTHNLYPSHEHRQCQPSPTSRPTTNLEKISKNDSLLLSTPPEQLSTLKRGYRNDFLAHRALHH